LIAAALALVIIAAIAHFSVVSVRLMTGATKTTARSQAVRFVVDRISSDIMASSGPTTGSCTAKLVLNNIAWQFRESKVRREEGSDAYYLTKEGEIADMKFFYPSDKLVRVELDQKSGVTYLINVYARN
jgi:hypothetical protein